MKKICVFMIACIALCFTQTIYAQDPSIDSVIASQKTTLMEAHSDLGNLLQQKYVRQRFPKQYSRIIALKRKSFELLTRIDQTQDSHEKIMYLSDALKNFNRAQIRCYKLTCKKTTP